MLSYWNELDWERDPPNPFWGLGLDIEIEWVDVEDPVWVYFLHLCQTSKLIKIIENELSTYGNTIIQEASYQIMSGYIFILVKQVYIVLCL